MNSILNESAEMVLMTPNGMTELVRGTDHRLVAEFAPVVRERSVALDLAGVDRIDAAGIAALISLYGCAREAGHRFALCNVSERVAEILTLVGLERVLVCHQVAGQPCVARTAA
jgi:anti-anti-sigma factor